MSKACYQTSVIDAEGDAVATAQVEIRNSSGGALASLFEDRDGLDGTDNPAFTDANGFIRVFLAEGTYHITVTHASFGTREYQYVVALEDHLSTEATGYAGHTVGAGDQNDYTAGGALDSSLGVLVINPSAGDAAITGFDASLLRNGQTITVINGHASNALTLKVNNTGSLAANRIMGAYDLTLPYRGACNVRYVSALNQLVLVP